MNDKRMNSLALSQIEHNMRWLDTHLHGVSTGIRNLPHRPPFTSAIEADLEALENKLMDALSQVREVQAAYQEKPIYRKAPDVDLRETCRLLSLQAAE